MTKNNLWIIIGILVLVGLFYVLKPTSVQPSSTKTFELTLKDKKVASGPATMTVTEGDEIDIKVTADKDGEFHVHGYDKELELKKDDQGEVKFAANLTGRFPIEFHESEDNKYEVAALEVQPK